jgi:hypothetical protein
MVGELDRSSLIRRIPSESGLEVQVAAFFFLKMVGKTIVR